MDINEKVFINDVEAISRTFNVLKNGGLVMHPTETCYGFAVDIFNKEALDKLYEVKGREENKPLSILVDSFEMANEYGVFSEKATKLAKKYWPGPLSIIVKRKKSLPDFLNKGQEGISIRFSSDNFCTEVVRKLGVPITTTSANVSGFEPLYEVNLDQFKEKANLIDLVVDGGKIQNNKPSTVVKVDGEKILILRQGALNIEI